MKYDFDQIIDRQKSDSIKWNFFEEDVLPLWVADMDFLPPPEVLSALQERIEHGIFGYSKTMETTKLAVQNWLHSRHGWQVHIDDIILIPGIVQAFNVAAAAFSQPGDSVLIQTPAYHPFFDVSKNTNLQQITSPLKREEFGRYSIDGNSFTESIKPDTRTFMLCNPHNPTGRVFANDELLLMAEACLENNVIICSDEIHSDIVHPGFKHIPIASLSQEIAESTITLVSTTKTFNLASLKSAAVIIQNPRLRELFSDQLSGFVGSVGILGEIGLAAAYENGSVWLTELLTYLEGNRQYLIDYVANELPGISMYPPEGTYLAWLDCSDLELPDPAEFFLKEAKVGLNSGDWFGDLYRDHVRINFGCPRMTLTSALERIKNALLHR